MKKLILISISLLLVTMASAQKLAKKPNYKLKHIEASPMTIPAFQGYVSDIDMQMTNNESKMSDLNFFAQNLQATLSKKTVSKIKSLDIEMNELKSDLDTYKKYGKGDWHIFQKEFDSDLKFVSKDVNYLHTILVREYLMIARVDNANHAKAI